MMRLIGDTRASAEVLKMVERHPQSSSWQIAEDLKLNPLRVEKILEELREAEFITQTYNVYDGYVWEAI